MWDGRSRNCILAFVRGLTGFWTWAASADYGSELPRPLGVWTNNNGCTIVGVVGKHGIRQLNLGPVFITTGWLLTWYQMTTSNWQLCGSRGEGDGVDGAIPSTFRRLHNGLYVPERITGVGRPSVRYPLKLFRHTAGHTS